LENQHWEAMAHDFEREMLKSGYSRRDFVKLAGVLGLSGLLAACGAVKPQTDQGKAAAGTPTTSTQSQYSISDANGLQWPKTVVPEPTTKVQITVAHSWEAAFWPRQTQFDTLFMKRHPNISVVTENTPFSNYLQKYVTQAAGGTLPDVMYCQYAWAQQFITQDAFYPLDDYIAKQPDFNMDDFTAPSLGFYKRSGKLYGVAYDCGPGMLFYNKDLFDKAGVQYPNDNWTLDDLKQAAIKLTSGTGHSKIFGLNAAPTPGNGSVAPSYLYPFGARYVDEPQETQCFINQPQAVQAMEWWMELLSKYQAVPNLSDQQSFLQQTAFTLGRAAMYHSGSWAAPALTLNAKFKWDIANWPKGPQKHVTFAAGSAYSMTKSCQQKDAAWIYMNEFLSSPGSIFMWGSTGRGSPARKSAWPSYFKSKFSPPGAQTVFQVLNSYATSDILHQPTTPKVTNTAQPIWDQVMGGKLAVKDALDQVTQQLTPILAQNNK